MITKVIDILGGFPLDALQMRKHLRFTSEKEDALIGSFISAAVQYAEHRTWRKFVLSRVVGIMDDFPHDDDFIEIALPPLVEVESVEYRKGDGSMEVLDPDKYRVFTESEPGKIAIKGHWPVTDGKTGAVRITFIAGYQTPAQVPAQLMQAVQMMTAHFFRNRESVIVAAGSVSVHSVPMATDALLDMYSLRVPI